MNKTISLILTGLVILVGTVVAITSVYLFVSLVECHIFDNIDKMFK